MSKKFATIQEKMSSVNEVPSWMLNQTRDKLGYIQETMSFLVDQALNSPALSWLGMEVNLDGLDLQEIEHMWTHNGQIVSVNGRVKQDTDHTHELDNQNDANGNQNDNNGNQDNANKLVDADRNQNTDNGNQEGMQGN